MEGEELELFADVFEAAAHEALDGVDGALRSGDEGAAGCVADGDGGAGVFGLGVNGVESDDGGDEVGAVDAGDDDGLVALHVGNEGVGGAEVDADDAFDGGIFRHNEPIIPKELGLRGRL